MDYVLNVRGRLLDLSQPQVMGILNVTPDSFFAGSRKQTEREIAERANQIVSEGATMIDIGAFSTRPGAAEVSEAEEMERLRFGLDIVRRELPYSIVSVDTFRPDVARMAVEEFGADIINDVSEGGRTGIANTPLPPSPNTQHPSPITQHPSPITHHPTPNTHHPTPNAYPPIFRMVAQLRVPYILMSVQPTLRQMLLCYAREVQQLRDLGVKDIILDPGFGFGKTLQQNYQVMDGLDCLQVLELPLLVGVSRKSMIFKLFGTTPNEALNGTTALHMVALMKGASILRVHDVREAVECVRIWQAINHPQS